MKPTILFDLDGTLIDSTEAIIESFYHSFDAFDRKPPKQEDIESKIGYTLEDIFSFLGIEDEYIDRHVKAYKEHYRVISKEKTILLENAREAIELAHSFATLGVVTTKTARYSKELLEHFGVMDKFGALIGREDVINVKPHAEPIQKAIKALNVEQTEKHKIWMIGDTFLDIEAAKNADIKHVALMTGYGDKEELKKISDIFVKDALEAVETIRKIY